MLRAKIRAVLVTMLVIFPVATLAQSPVCPLAAGDTVARAISQVERRPVADSANVAPPYPDLLRQAGIGGPVRVAFTLDTSGRVEGAGLRVVRTANPGFDQAVKRAVVTWRYAPGSVCGHPVRVRLTHEFAFQRSATPRDTLRLDQLFNADAAAVATADTLPDGTPRTTVGWRATAVVVASRPWDSAALDSAEEAAVAQLVENIGPAPDGTSRVVCLAGKGGLTSDPDSGRLVRLTRPGIAVLSFRRCPPTFASMVRTPNESPYPPGEDPFAIVVHAWTSLSSTRMVFNIDALHGTGGTHYRCGVERHESAWRVRCVSLSSWMS